MFKGWRNTDKGFFDQFEKELEEMNKMMNSMMQSIEDKSVFYGFNVQARQQNVRSEQDIREPFTSTMIDEKNKEFKITVEMPGISKEDIEVSAIDEEVFIKAEDGGRKYFKNIKTPVPIDTDISRARYNNGVLEVTFKLKELHKPKGKKVNIE